MPHDTSELADPAKQRQLTAWLGNLTAAQARDPRTRARMETALGGRGTQLTTGECVDAWIKVLGNPEFGPRWVLGPGLDIAAVPGFALDSIFSVRVLVAQVGRLAAADLPVAQAALDTFAHPGRLRGAVEPGPYARHMLWEQLAAEIRARLDDQWSVGHPRALADEVHGTDQELGLEHHRALWAAVMRSYPEVPGPKPLGPPMFLAESSWSRRWPQDASALLVEQVFTMTKRGQDPTIMGQHHFASWLTGQAAALGVECPQAHALWALRAVEVMAPWARRWSCSWTRTVRPAAST